MPNKETKSDTTSDTKTSTAKALSTVEERLEQEQKQGFRGVEVDPTPNENYTVAGVTSGKGTPETDVAAAKEARGVTGLGLSALEAEAINKRSK